MTDDNGQRSANGSERPAPAGESQAISPELAAVIAQTKAWELEIEARRQADALADAAEEAADRERRFVPAQAALGEAIEHDVRNGWYILERTGDNGAAPPRALLRTVRHMCRPEKSRRPTGVERTATT